VERVKKLITQYDASRNQYSVLRHNLTPDEANDAVREISARRFGLFVVEQGTEHSEADPEECQACRRDVEKTSHVRPKPSFKRRHV
jgi:hypothetical protein